MADPTNIMKPEERCGLCKFWQVDPTNVKVGMCRRFPPSYVMVPQPNGSIALNSCWPAVDNNKWCGEYRPRNAI